jgi:hypothetical protein
MAERILASKRSLDAKVAPLPARAVTATPALLVLLPLIPNKGTLSLSPRPISAAKVSTRGALFRGRLSGACTLVYVGAGCAVKPFLLLLRQVLYIFFFQKKQFSTERESARARGRESERAREKYEEKNIRTHASAC